MKITKENKEAFNKACCVAMESVRPIDLTGFLVGVKSGIEFAEKVNHHLLHDKNSKFCLNALELTALAGVYVKYRKLLKKSRKTGEVKQ